ncbi:peptidoglycan endopeptidase [[Mycobacterium] wendilense]|uniref:Peptidoglycan endopeptidase n=1 Tax=[Mycobacterium] wendilense TaxID=3064284 RepID=A0ABM9MF03_9MYCO|nr:peptidoglycan endopeptidase [Mycolicibacterium sp. MU0050]CAJ1583628.1 peptidoglycan endopeptidase [Mycolicibacterium sp. MU0050]
MFALATLLTLVNQVSGTPYIPGGDSPNGTDCSGLASWVANAATGRPIYGDRFHTGNQERALLARGFKYGTAPNALVIGWNGGHTAVTLPDGTPVSSGEGGGVKIGGGGAYQSQFTKHMYLPAEEMAGAQPAPADPMLAPPPAPVILEASTMMPPPPPPPPPAPLPPPGPEIIPANAMFPPPPPPPLPPADPMLPPPPSAPVGI